MKSLFIFSIAFMSVLGCSRTITPKYVYPERYTTLSCRELFDEQKHLDNKLQKLDSDLTSENEDTTGGVSQDYNRTIEEQISMSQGEQKVVEELIISKSCRLD